jgi:MFS family permease
MLVAVQGIGSLIGIVACGRLSGRLSERTMALASAALILVGTVPWIGLSPRTGTAALLVGLVVRGAGLSALMNSAYAVAYGTLERAALPGATAALNIVSRVSAAAGVAIAVIVVERRAPDIVQAGVARANVAAAFGDVFLLFGVLAVLAVVATAVLPAGRSGSRIAPALT